MNSPASTKTESRVDVALLRSHFLVYLALSTAVVGQPLLQLYGENLTIFTTAGFEGIGILGFMGVVLFSIPLLFTVSDAVVQWLAPRFSRVLHYSFVYLLCIGVVLVLTRSLDRPAWILHLLGAGVVAAGLLWLFHRFDGIKTWARWMSLLAVIVAFTFTFSVRDLVWVPEVTALDVNQSTQNDSTVPSEDVSVVWVVLDEAPLFPLVDQQGQINRERFPGFAALADASTWYRNALSGSQTTTDAVPSMLTGLKPKVGAPPILATHEKNIFTLMNSYSEFDVREFTTSLCPDSVCGTIYSSSSTQAESETTDEQVISASKTFSFQQFLKDSLVVLGHKILPAQLRDNLPAIDETWGGFGGNDDVVIDDEFEKPIDDNEEDIVESSLDAETQEEVRAGFRSDGPASLIPAFEAMVERAQKSASSVLHFQHVMLPHRPWKLTPDQRTYPQIPNPGRVKDVTVPDNSTDENVLIDQYQSFLMQYTGVDAMIGKMVTDLKQSDNWDRTMIVVVADHGLSMEGGTTRRRVVNPNQPGTLEDLYRVPLFIKYPAQQEPVISDCDVMHVDILPTVAGVKGLDAGWTYDGVDLRDNCPDRPSREVNWPDGKTNLTSDWTAILDRVELYNSYVPVSGGVDGIFSYGRFAELISTPVTSTSRSSSISSWSVDQKDQFNNISAARFAQVPVMISGEITVSQSIPKDAVGVITVDGVVAGFVGEVSGVAGGETVSYTAAIATSQLKSGSQAVALTIVSGTPQSPTYEMAVSPR
ncbi:MAG: hypothetical protein RIR69_979 [Actinomycetota bacterium]|jgi:hypothetical protein